MSDLYVEFAGDSISPDALVGPKARDLASRAIAGQLSYVRLIECRQSLDLEALVLDVEVELGQEKVNDIHATERVAVWFFRNDSDKPEVLALCTDFPSVPHLNLRNTPIPRSLCLFEEPYRELKPHWTAALFVERLREWLRLTGRGELHAEDQPLEPLLLETAGRIILPHDLFAAAEPHSVGAAAGLSSARLVPIEITQVRQHSGRWIVKAERVAVSTAQGTRAVPPDRTRSHAFVAIACQLAPRQHGVISHTPRTLRELHDFLAQTGEDLLTTIRAQALQWKDAPGALDARVVIVVSAPKIRQAGADVETYDLWAFMTGVTVRELGIAVGRWELHQGEIATLLSVREDLRGESVGLDVLNVIETLSRNDLAFLNGRAAADDRQLVGIGVGALGSQIVMNAARSAYGRWTVIDEDLLLPHNLARHVLDHSAVGWPKVEPLAWTANRLADDAHVHNALVVDVVQPPEDERELLNESLTGADAIVDMSASVPVARHLAFDIRAQGRRVSLFLNPSGTDLVVLAEDQERRIQLDALEMQYYRALIRLDALAGHLRPPNDRVRYGRSCRDVSIRLPHEFAALHGAIGARALRGVLDRAEASVTVWRADPDQMTVSAHAIPPNRVARYPIGEWTVVVDDGLLDIIDHLRASKLPNETGGVLIGTFDLERRIVYIADTIASPPDSEEWPVLYIRGCKGLPNRVAAAAEATGGQLDYIGEWHSHPDGYECRPSADDVKVFAWLTEHMDAAGLPALMMIAGENRTFATFLGQMVMNEIAEENLVGSSANGS